MKTQEKHYQQLIKQIGDRQVRPPAGMEQRFRKEFRSPIRPLYSFKNWIIAASVTLAFTMSWVLWMDTHENVLSFPSSVTIQQFQGADQSVESVYRVDRNFHVLRESYARFN